MGMIPSEPDCYGVAYHEGVRLHRNTNGLASVLDKALEDADADMSGYHEVIRRRLACYVLGFSDGWHGVPPLAEPRSPF